MTINIGTQGFRKLQNLRARVPLPDSCSGVDILRIYCDERFPQLSDHVSALEGTESLWSHEASRNDNMERPKLRASSACDGVRPPE
jgi:hypothetical protein